MPRDQVRHVEDRLRKVEQHVADLEQEHWRRTNPETKARSEGLAAQLNSAIAKLESELAEAQAAGDARRIKDAEDALNARRIWLDARSWIDHARGWVAGADRLFLAVLDAHRWGQHSRWMYDRRVLEPRLTAWWEVGSGTPLRAPVAAVGGPVVARTLQT